MSPLSWGSIETTSEGARDRHGRLFFLRGARAFASRADSLAARFAADFTGCAALEGTASRANPLLVDRDRGGDRVGAVDIDRNGTSTGIGQLLSREVFARVWSVGAGVAAHRLPERVDQRRSQARTIDRPRRAAACVRTCGARARRGRGRVSARARAAGTSVDDRRAAACSQPNPCAQRNKNVTHRTGSVARGDADGNAPFSIGGAPVRR